MSSLAELTVKAHQYLYYVKASPILTDYEYDMFCRDHGVESKGGSDLESSYTLEEKILAEELLKNRFK